jgi:putative ubiquitin-RnfH superfamily antitoxin RatB of RatAB toxin-antitoxin module
MERDPMPETVEVVYATPQAQRVVTLSWQDGLTAGEALRRSGLLEEFPEIGQRPLVLGLFGLRVEPDRLLRQGERVEVCRPLERDPRALRRELLKQGQVMGGAGRKPDKSERR